MTINPFNENLWTIEMLFVEKPPYYSNPTCKIGLLSSVYTLMEYRRNGIAKQLLSNVVNEAKEPAVF